MALDVFRDEGGQAIVLLATSIAFLLGFTALTLDAGRVFIEHQKLQSVADAASLAGVSYLPQSPSQAEAAAAAIAQKNGVAPSALTMTVTGTSSNQLDVTAETRIPLLLGRLIGVSSTSVSATSGAETGPLAGLRGAVPVGVFQQTFTPGETFTLKSGAGGGSQGNYGALSFSDGSGASTYENDLENGADLYISNGEAIQTKPGNMAGPTEKAVSYRISEDPFGTQCDTTSPRLMWVPVISEPTKGGRATVTVTGFAAFWLKSDVGGQIEGVFCKENVNGEVAATYAPSTTGVKGERLVH